MAVPPPPSSTVTITGRRNVFRTVVLRIRDRCPESDPEIVIHTGKQQQVFPAAVLVFDLLSVFLLG